MQILPVKQNYCTKEYLCSPQGSNPVKIKHASISRAVPCRLIAQRVARFAVVLALVSAAFTAVAQTRPTSDTIDQIRVIGNRRIPKETILARMFTHPGDTYDPISIERDFHSLWNTGYFEDLRIEREDSEKGIILNVFVREKPSIREINYKGLNSVSVSDVLDRFKKEKVPLSVESQYDATKITRAETVIKRAARRARPPVRHHQDRRQDHSAGLGAGQLQYQGRPGCEGGQNPVRGQPAHQLS